MSRRISARMTFVRASATARATSSRRGPARAFASPDVYLPHVCDRAGRDATAVERLSARVASTSRARARLLDSRAVAPGGGSGDGRRASSTGDALDRLEGDPGGVEGRRSHALLRVTIERTTTTEVRSNASENEPNASEATSRAAGGDVSRAGGDVSRAGGARPVRSHLGSSARSCSRARERPERLLGARRRKRRRRSRARGRRLTCARRVALLPGRGIHRAVGFDRRRLPRGGARPSRSRRARVSARRRRRSARGARDPADLVRLLRDDIPVSSASDETARGLSDLEVALPPAPRAPRVRGSARVVAESSARAPRCASRREAAASASNKSPSRSLVRASGTCDGIIITRRLDRPRVRGARGGARGVGLRLSSSRERVGAALETTKSLLADAERRAADAEAALVRSAYFARRRRRSSRGVIPLVRRGGRRAEPPRTRRGAPAAERTDVAEAEGANARRRAGRSRRRRRRRTQRARGGGAGGAREEGGRGGHAADASRAAAEAAPAPSAPRSWRRSLDAR